MVVYHWTLNASGGAITIDGVDAGGALVKIRNVKSVTREAEAGLFRNRSRLIARDAQRAVVADLR